MKIPRWWGGFAAPYSLVLAALLTGTAISGLCQLPPPGQLPAAPPPQPGQVATPSTDTTNTPAAPVPEPASNAASADSRDAELLIRENVRNVIVPTTVIDKDTGGYINGLKADDFHLYDNDKLQHVNADYSFQPLSVVLVVQANSDVDSILPKVRKAGVLLQGLVTGETGDVAVLAFDHRRRLIQDFTNDPAKLDDAMQKITAGSSTAALIDAILEADHMLLDHDRTNTRRRVILLISRDVDKGSEAHLQETARKIQFDNVIVYCVNMSKLLTVLEKKPDYPRPANGGIPPEAMPNGRGNINNDTTVLQQADGNVLSAVPPIYRSIRDVFKKTPGEALTRFTGGKMYGFASNAALERAISDIGKELQSQYLLSYSPNNKEDPGFHTIRIVVDQPRLEIRQRPGYWWGGGQQ